MIYITGDTHRDFKRFDDLDLTEEDLIVVLGDVGINYFQDLRDQFIKVVLSKLPCKFFFVRGNHEQRPSNISTYEKVHVDGIVTGEVYIEKKFPKLMFADEGLYEIGGCRCFVSNGAYSIDKYYRLANDMNWFPDEELSDEEMKQTLAKAAAAGYVDWVFTHTCPAKYIPAHTFGQKLDSSGFSKRMEEFYDKLEEVLDYGEWYCGHFHTEWTVDRIHFLYQGILSLSIEENWPAEW